MQEQTRQALRNVQTILKATGGSLERVVKLTFPDVKPVRFGADIPGVLVAIEAIALA